MIEQQSESANKILIKTKNIRRVLYKDDLKWQQSKTVLQNRLRMVVFIYIIATASHSKTVPYNRLRMCVVKYPFFSSV